MEPDLLSGGDVGEVGVAVQQQGQLGALAEVGWRTATAGQEVGLDEEIAREAGLVGRSRAGQESCP